MMIYIKKLLIKKNNQVAHAFTYGFFIVLSLLTLGCSSTDTSIQYYSLNAIGSQTENVKTIKKSEDSIFVVINNIELADFLSTGGLVMQIDSHQLNISNQHRWGDKLEKAIYSHLLTSLSNEDSKIYIESKNSNNRLLADKYLSLSFEQFTVTDQALGANNETVVAGTYTIMSKIKGQDMESEKIFFDIRQPLTQDGYNHAVENFKHSLDRLSKQIQNNIQITE